MWFIIAIFGFIGAFVTLESNPKISSFSHMIGNAAATVMMFEFTLEFALATISNDIAFYIMSISTLILAIATISSFIQFMKQL